MIYCMISDRILRRESAEPGVCQATENSIELTYKARPTGMTFRRSTRLGAYIAKSRLYNEVNPLAG